MAEIPSYRVETDVYPALPVAQRLYTFSMVDTLDQRRGNLGQQIMGDAVPNGGWGRVNGSAGSIHNSGPDGLALSFNQGFLQTGLDLFGLTYSGGGKTLTGFFIAAGQASSSSSTPLRGTTGQSGLSAYSLGLYATHFEPNGLYADALIQATRFINGRSSSVVGTAISSDGWSGSASLEAGWRLTFNAAYVVPQAQIVADTFSLSGASDPYGTIIFPSQTYLRGRLGLMAGNRFRSSDDDQKTIDIWVRANVWNVFNGDAKTQFATSTRLDPVMFSTAYGSSWLGLDGGVTAQLSKQSALYANAGYDYGFGLARQAFTGRIGLQAQW